MLLIITNQKDLACDYLILRLKECGIPFKRLNTERFGSDYSIELNLSNNYKGYRIAFRNGEVVCPEDVTAVYFRQPAMPTFGSEAYEADLEFANREVAEIFRSLWRLIDSKIWLNHPKNLWLASNKVEQLSVATDMGFYVPRTCVCHDSQHMKDFISNVGGRIVAKAVKHGFYEQNGCVTVATTVELPKNLPEQYENYLGVPMILQELVEKRYDIRVTVVADQVFATAIYSQQYQVTQIDWRLWDLYDIDLVHRPIELPASISELCLRLTRHFGLRYSAIDLIYDSEGKYVFLELNPNGQWMWIEQLTGAPIRDAIIDALGLKR